MNVSSRVPGSTRNSGWQAVDAEIASKHVRLQPTRSDSTPVQGRGDEPLAPPDRQER
jgi:hypothetical protein